MSRILKALLLSLFVFALFSRDGTFATIVAMCFGLSLIPNLVGRRIWLPPELDLCCTSILFAHVFFGMTLGLYETSSLYDKVAHLVGAAVLAWQALKILDRERVVSQLLLSCRVVIGLVLGVALAMGAAWEIFEFTIDSTQLVVSQRGLTDTMHDLIAGFIGGTIPVILRFCFRSRRKREVGRHQSHFEMASSLNK